MTAGAGRPLSLPLAGLIRGAGVGLLAWQLAAWTWVFAVPPALPVRLPPPRLAPVARQLFPGSGRAAGFDPGQYHVTGIWAGVGAFAVIGSGDQPGKTFGVGDELAPGVRITDIRPRSVGVEANGETSRLKLDLPGDLLRDDPRVAVLDMGGGHFDLSAADVQRVPAAVAGFPQQARVAAARPGSLAWQLGLRAGDRIVRIDGATAVPATIAALPGRLKQPGEIRLVVRRRGREWTLTWTIDD